MNGAIYFVANNQYYQPGLWKTDGTSSGTVQLVGYPLDAATSVQNIGNLTNVNGKLYFTAQTYNEFGALGIEAWQSDGTAAGTSIVRDIDGRWFSWF